MNLNINKLRNKTIDATVSVLNKAKAKPPTAGTEVRNIIDDPNLSVRDKLDALQFLTARLEESADA